MGDMKYLEVYKNTNYINLYQTSFYKNEVNFYKENNDSAGLI